MAVEVGEKMKTKVVGYVEMVFIQRLQDAHNMPIKQAMQ